MSSCYISAPPLSVCQTSSPTPLPALLWATNPFIPNIYAAPGTRGCTYTLPDAHIHAARAWDARNRHRQTIKQTSQAEQVTTLSTLFIFSFSILFSCLPLEWHSLTSCITYHSAVLSEEQRACHGGGCVRVAHIVRGSAACTGVLPLQWSG